MVHKTLFKIGFAILTAEMLFSLFQNSPPAFGNLDYTIILFALSLITYAVYHPIEKNHKKILVLLLALAILIRIPIITGDFITIIKYFFADDAYIWLSVARELYENHWYSFNGIEPAAGGPPVWALILAAFHYVIKDPYLMTRVVLSTNLILFVGSALLLYAIARRYIPVKWCLFMITLYLFNPYILFFTMNGMETILLITLLLAVVLFYQKYEFNTKNSIVLGVLLGLTTLTRDEGILLYPAILTSLLFASRKSGEKLKIKELAYMTFAFVIVISPWVTYKLWTFNTINSSNSLQRFRMSHDWIDPKTLGVKELVTRSTRELIIVLKDSSKIFDWPLYLVGLSYFLLNFKKMWREPFAVYAIYNVLFYGFIVWVGGRYNIPFHTFMCFAIAYALYIILKVGNEKIRLGVSKKKFIGTFIPILIILLVFNSTYISYKRLDEWMGIYKNPDVLSQYDEYLAAMWIKENLPSGSIIAVYNIGVEQYFSGAHIIDVYGNMDYAAQNAFKEKRTWEYMKERNVSYYIARLDTHGEWNVLNWTEDFRSLPLIESWKVWESPNEKYAIYKMPDRNENRSSL